MKAATFAVRILDSDAFRDALERIEAFISEYAWHARGCAAVDADGEWHRGNPPCDCGYDEALASLTQSFAEKAGR